MGLGGGRKVEQATDVYDGRALPSPHAGFDEPDRLDAFLDAVRWGAIASADKTALQGPFRSGVEIQDYQLDPVVRALPMPRTNLLIADDVGLGAYDWTDLDLKHAFHETRQGPRFTVAPDVQTEILDHLLELNHARYEDEVKRGLHTPEAKKRRAAARKAKAKARAAARSAKGEAGTNSAAGEDFEDGLFPQPDALF